MILPPSFCLHTVMIQRTRDHPREREGARDIDLKRERIAERDRDGTEGGEKDGRINTF